MWTSKINIHHLSREEIAPHAMHTPGVLFRALCRHTVHTLHLNARHHIQLQGVQTMSFHPSCTNSFQQRLRLLVSHPLMQILDLLDINPRVLQCFQISPIHLCVPLWRLLVNRRPGHIVLVNLISLGSIRAAENRHHRAHRVPLKEFLQPMSTRLSPLILSERAVTLYRRP